MNTPWGSSQTVETITDGVKWVTTASHGGLMVRDNLSILTPKAIEVAHPGGHFNGYVCFEEDCSYAVAFFEHPEWKRFLDAKTLAEYRKQLKPDEELYSDYTRNIQKYMREAIPGLESRVAMSDAEISAEMRATIERWNPEYFGLPNHCWQCNVEMGVGVGNGVCESCRKAVRA